MNLFKRIKKEVVNESLKPLGLNDFINQYVDNISNPFIISMLNRMLETNSFYKFGVVVFEFTEEEKVKLEEFKPMLFELLEKITVIKQQCVKKDSKWGM